MVINTTSIKELGKKGSSRTTSTGEKITFYAKGYTIKPKGKKAIVHKSKNIKQ
jgi:hypothetical protein